MREPDEFDQFYRDVRTRLLLLTYCLTGDLSVSRSAVRDAFVAAWHHWRKVARYDDPEAWVRVRACRQAQRRQTAKLWHREKGLDPEVKATLDSLDRLSSLERRVLLVTELSNASLGQMAREVGVPQAEAERVLQQATAQFALHREVPSTSVRSVLEAVGGHLLAARLPRATIIRRAGAARRRTHTIVGVAAAAAALVVTGGLVTDTDGARPTLAGERMDGVAPARNGVARVPVALPENTLLDATAVGGVLSARAWTDGDVGDNTDGDGTALPCQTDRYAGRRPDAAWVRTVDSAGRRAPTLTQMTEAARNEQAAVRAYSTALMWFAGCAEGRAQLTATYDVPGVGDQAKVIALRTWDRPARSILAAIGRTGQFTSSVVVSAPPGAGPGPEALGRLVAAAVQRLCDLPQAGACATDAAVERAAPVPVASVPEMLAEVDLPPVTGVAKPWFGSEPSREQANAAATTCDKADFTAKPVQDRVTRTFLIPEARFPDEFGVTQTIGTLPLPKARAFVADIRDKVDRCPDRSLGTEVVRLHHEAGKQRDLTVWRVSTEVSDERTVVYLMGVVRSGRTVAQVGFIPDGPRTIEADAFVDLVDRALERLPARSLS